jgi:inner membrane protein
MDNFTHSLAGWALGQAGLKTLTRKGLAALILGANMPDIDVFFGWFPWEPLAMHRGFTHSLIGGTILMPPILFGLLLLLDRWQVARGACFKSGLAMHKGWLLALCYLGALTHPLLDLQTTYSVQLLSPVSGAWFHADSLFIIDAFLWCLLPAAIAWSRWREKRGFEWRRPVQIALIVAVAYIGFNIGISETATQRVKQRIPQATAIFASPPPVLFWRRDLRWRQDGRIGGASWSMVGGFGPSAPLLDDGMDDDTVKRIIAQDPEMRRFLGWSILPVARVRTSDCAIALTVADARYMPIGSDRSRLSYTATARRC